MTITRAEAMSILEVGAGASQETIRAAYLKMSRKWHPDKRAENEREQATLQFQKIAASYNILLQKGHDATVFSDEDLYRYDDYDYDSELENFDFDEMDAEFGFAGFHGVFFTYTAEEYFRRYNEYCTEDEEEDYWDYSDDYAEPEYGPGMSIPASNICSQQWRTTPRRPSVLTIDTTSVMLNVGPNSKDHAMRTALGGLPYGFLFEVQYRESAGPDDSWYTLVKGWTQLETSFNIPGLAPDTVYVFRSRRVHVTRISEIGVIYKKDGPWSCELTVKTCPEVQKGATSQPGQGKNAKKNMRRKAKAKAKAAAEKASTSARV